MTHFTGTSSEENITTGGSLDTPLKNE